MIPKYDLSDFIFMVTALVFHQHGSKRPQKTYFAGVKSLKEKEPRENKSNTNKERNWKKTKTKINVLNCMFFQGSNQVSEWVHGQKIWKACRAYSGEMFKAIADSRPVHFIA